MHSRTRKIARFVGRRAVTASALLFAFYVNALSEQQTPASLQPPPVTAQEKISIKGFAARLNDYVRVRNRVKARLPKLSKDSTPEQLETYRKAFDDGMRAARANAKDGDLFRAGIATYIRKTLRTEFQGKDRAELRDIVFDEETAGVPLRVNYPYPEKKEFTEMPATLLAKLPEIPKELRYRFVGRHLLLVDRDNNLIIDYMHDALP
ncbi:MAG TPA: hypothetical protein VJT50_16890 [Pyrinomonadaceae bacterium]|nr:hypothetical protein [Pyrinomonadaceae bacterium]